MKTLSTDPVDNPADNVPPFDARQVNAPLHGSLVSCEPWEPASRKEHRIFFGLGVLGVAIIGSILWWALT